MNKKTVILVNLSNPSIYKDTKVEIGVPIMPSLTQATLAAPLRKEGFEVKILDLNLEEEPKKAILGCLKKNDPGFVGITLRTASYNQMKEACKLIKEFNKKITIILGGPHINVFPKDTLKESEADISVVGEGDFILPEICKGKELSQINNIFYKKDNEIKQGKEDKIQYINNLDDLPFPDWSLFDIHKYKTPWLSCKARPAGPIETSRGCPGHCTYCSKLMYGYNFRPKSVKRVVDEIEYMVKCGFKEIQIIEDSFSTDMNRAKKICDEIIKRKIKVDLNVVAGLRADKVDLELLQKLKKAGCYRVSCGVESGSQKILNNIKKGITLEQIRRVFKLAKKARLEVQAFFMIGLPGETTEDIQATIDFAKELNPYIAKLGILTPLPGTELYNDWDSKGHIISKEWSKYHFHNFKGVYKHPILDWQTIQKYYDKFYKEFYLRPSFLINRTFEDIRKGRIKQDLSAFISLVRSLI